MRRILFLHVPKCAGTSIHRAIVAAGSSVYSGDEWFVRLNHRKSCAEAKKLGLTLWEYRETILLDWLRSPVVRLISGHFAHSVLAQEECVGEVILTTVLRAPEERFLSHYRYNARRTDGHFSIQEPLEAFVSTPRAIAWGSMITRLFTDPCRRVHAVDSTAIKSAITNLRRYHVVGFVDRLTEFERAFREATGFVVNIGRQNVGPTCDHGVPSGLRRQIASLCAPDQTVYDAVRNETHRSLQRRRCIHRK